jgi:hypothetical protein
MLEESSFPQIFGQERLPTCPPSSFLAQRALSCPRARGEDPCRLGRGRQELESLQLRRECSRGSLASALAARKRRSLVAWGARRSTREDRGDKRHPVVIVPPIASTDAVQRLRHPLYGEGDSRRVLPKRIPHGFSRYRRPSRAPGRFLGGEGDALSTYFERAPAKPRRPDPCGGLPRSRAWAREDSATIRSPYGLAAKRACARKA